MRRLSRYILVLGIASAAPFAATGQPVPPGEEGELAGFLPPEEGARICYRRAYSPEHLAKHPDQTVTEVEFRLAYYRHDADEFYPQGQRNYYFAMLAKRRGGDRTLTAFGECVPGSKGISCGIDCDGGGVHLTRRPADKVLLDLTGYGRIRMSEGCDEADAVELEPGKDDREFLLTKIEDSACPAYDDW